MRKKKRLGKAGGTAAGPPTWARIDPVRRKVISRNENYTLGILWLTFAMFFPVIGRMRATFGDLNELGIRMVPFSLVYTILTTLYAYTNLRIRAVKKTIPTAEAIVSAERLSARGLVISTAIFGATIALGLSATSLMSMPALWLVEHVAVLKEVGAHAVEKVIYWVIGGAVFEVIRSWFVRRIRRIGSRATKPVPNADLRRP